MSDISCFNSGLGFGGSDLDLGIYFDNMDVHAQHQFTTSERLNLLSTVCSLVDEDYEIVEFVQHARIPVIKLWSPTHQLACDICIGSVHVLLNTALLKWYAQMDPRVRPLFFAVKYWATQRNLNDSVNGTLSSYGWALLLIFYLQSPQTQALLPPMGSIFPLIQQETNLENVLSRLNSISYEDRSATFGSVASESVGALLHGFFQYYATEFNYKEQVVSVRTGHVLLKETTWTRSVRWRLSIEDPFEVAHDVGRVFFSLQGQMLLQQEFKRAYELIQHGARLVDVCVTVTTTCYVCGENTHKARECNQMTFRMESKMGLECWYCGEAGHIKSSCPSYAFLAIPNPISYVSSPTTVDDPRVLAVAPSTPVLIPSKSKHKKKKRPRHGSLSSASSSPEHDRSHKYIIAASRVYPTRKCNESRTKQAQLMKMENVPLRRS